MPHSPYTQTVQPPIADLESYARDLKRYRVQYDEDSTDKYAAGELLEIGEGLYEQCQFLDVKLDIKVSIGLYIKRVLSNLSLF